MAKKDEIKQIDNCDDKEKVTEGLPMDDIGAAIGKKRKIRYWMGWKKSVDEYIPVSNRVILD